MSESTTFVYLYLASEAIGEELKFSIRSVQTHFAGRARFWVVGDRPDWYAGDFLAAPRRPETSNPRIDVAAKFRAVLDASGIPETFVWMMDDVYFLGPLDLAALRRPCSRGEMTPERLAAWRPRRRWLQDKHRGWSTLAERARPLHDYCTHLPCVFEKARLRALFQRYPLAREPMPIDLLYFNEFVDGPPEPVGSILHRESKRPDARTLRRRLHGALLFNHGHRAYTPAVEQVLKERFPEPSDVERK